MKLIEHLALNAHEATERELTADQRKNFEFWVSVGCGILLFSAVIGVELWEVMHHGSF